MAGKKDQMKGKAKEAVGDLTGNEDLKSEGTADRQAGEVKEKVGKVEEKVEEGIDKVKDTLHKK
ncbi:CsbD family protein [Ferrimicrobium sp.]|uniref:CsbD family protein n=1 Tax=Ferrimicrobium sp. TaxID=2926050 RepID=UPI0026146776|nr:CsbD family protein [Ferrimicrobium sp.]